MKWWGWRLLSAGRSAEKKTTEKKPRKDDSGGITATEAAQQGYAAAGSSPPVAVGRPVQHQHNKKAQHRRPPADWRPPTHQRAGESLIQERPVAGLEELGQSHGLSGAVDCRVEERK